MIRKHIIPRTNLYDPDFDHDPIKDFDHDPIKDLRLKEMRVTHVQYVTGKSKLSVINGPNQTKIKL